VIEAPQVQLTNGLVRTIDKPTSLPTASPEYPSGDAKRFHPGRVGCKAGGELTSRLTSRLVKNDVALMVRQAHHEGGSLKTLSLILSLSKDEAKISYFFSSLLE
jgi:hypothetical protein